MPPQCRAAVARPALCVEPAGSGGTADPPTRIRPTTDLYDSVLADRRQRPVSRAPAPARLDGHPLTAWEPGAHLDLSLGTKWSPGMSSKAVTRAHDAAELGN